MTTRTGTDAPEHSRAMRLLHPIAEVGHLLGGLSRTALYEEIKAGRLRIVKVGRRTFVAASEMDRYIAALVEASASQKASDVRE